MKVKKAHWRRCHDEFKKLEISKGQPKILDYLVEHDGSIQKDIAKNCNIEAATVTSILSIMEKVGFVERRPNKDDRRIINVYLTEKGRRVQVNSQKVISQIERDCFSDFNEEEMKQLKNFFERMYNNLNKDGEKKND
ncbi:MAG: MarR family transcriptional regulator [Clostridium sp.]|nr:MarR family transcriptional regulator [Clostridium sp.]